MFLQRTPLPTLLVVLSACDGGASDWTPPAVRINELVASNASGLSDASGAFPDWLELYNDDDEVVDLSELTLTDDPTEPQKSLFPAGTQIAAGGYLVVFVDADPSTAGEVHADFQLAATTGETLQLIGPALEDFPVIDEVTFPPMPTDQAYALIGGGFEITPNPTPGAANE